MSKLACSIDSHRSLDSCLEALETVREPSSSSAKMLKNEVPCLLARTKHHIIRLRRGEHRDWPYFRADIITHQKELCRLLDTRWLVSICDTFVDFGNDLERRNAMLVSLLGNWEKLALTRKLLFSPPEDDPAPVPNKLSEMSDSVFPLWDGMSSMLMSEKANVMENLFGRLHDVLRETPLIFRIMGTLLQRIADNSDSTLAALNAPHESDLFDESVQLFQKPDDDIDNYGAAVHASTPDLGGLRGLVANLEQSNAAMEYLIQQSKLAQVRSTMIEKSITSSVASGMAEIQQSVNSVARDILRLSDVEDTRYRDLLEITVRNKDPFAPPSFELETDFPLAAASADHLFPLGTVKDNTRSPRFVKRCEDVFDRKISFMDLGCAGGGLVFDFALNGHRSIGLEGSDHNKKTSRAEWRGLSDRLMTCDITKHFDIVSGPNKDRAQFEVISAWDVLEHLSIDGVRGLLENVRNHLAADGVFVGSVSTRASGLAPDGSPYHVTVQNREQWLTIFEACHFETVGEKFFGFLDYPRGNGVDPINIADFRKNPELGFHFQLTNKS